MQNLILRESGYYLRKVIPADLRPYFHKTNFVISLYTRSKAEAFTNSQLLLGRINRTFFELRGANEGCKKKALSLELMHFLEEFGEVQKRGAKTSLAPFPSRKKVKKYTTPDTQKGLTLSQLYDKFEHEKKLTQWSQKAVDDYRTAFKALVDILGDIPAKQLSKEQGNTYVEVLLVYPQRRTLGKNARYTLAELIQKKAPSITPTTAKNHCTRVNVFFNWLVSKGYTKENPITGLAPKGKRTATKKEAFSHEDLVHIFSQPLFKDKQYKSPWQYWLPLLAYFTGARLEELAQLKTTDVKAEGSIIYLQIHNEDGNQLKNEGSRRVIPLHDILLNLGFLTYVEQQQNIKLFNLSKVTGKYGKRVTNWFSKFKRSLGFPSSKVFHSFRHSFRDAAVEASIPSEHIKALLGHAQKDITHGVYGSGFSLRLLNESLQRVDFKEVREVLL
ncbi:tyrosine-type recombinase/integrase [Zooshikella sp. RANM57]|uniref:tyrosine-type recombinase/integrase n=1 Tax=Zooshikella sp. RANM57 TaxID=3425863 RepID=UPI003D6F2366